MRRFLIITFVGGVCFGAGFLTADSLEDIVFRGSNYVAEVSAAHGAAERIATEVSGSSAGEAAEADSRAIAAKKKNNIKIDKRQLRLSARSYIVADISSGEILLEHNPDLALPIASLTKLLTALAGLEFINQREIVTVSQSAIATESVAGGFIAGEKIKASDLIYPLLLESSNDAAEALAGHFGRDKFIGVMNGIARGLGMSKSKFEDPSGLSPGNVASAADLFRLVSHIYKERRAILDVTKLKEKKVEADKGSRAHRWPNRTTAALAENPDFLGGKIGFTDEARHTLISVFNESLGENAKERPLAIIVLASDSGKMESERLRRFVAGNMPSDESEKSLATDSLPEEINRAYSLFFVGDIMLDRGVLKSIQKNGKGDFSFPFAKADTLSRADLLFGNLEGPISDKGKDAGNLYSFRMKPASVAALKDVGFDVLSVANNHSGDWGRDAFEDTLERLKSSGIAHAGGGQSLEEVIIPTTINLEGLKIGFLAFSDVGPKWLAAEANRSGILLATSPSEVAKAVSFAKKYADMLVVSFHFGDEYEKQPSFRQRALAEAAVSAGAKIVVGHHPHVVQPVESYRGGIIAYSLGNFIFDQYFSRQTMEAGILEVAVSGTGALLSHKLHTAPLSPQFQPIFGKTQN